jgi:hypothetical protein
MKPASQYCLVAVFLFLSIMLVFLTYTKISQQPTELLENIFSSITYYSYISDSPHFFRFLSLNRLSIFGQVYFEWFYIFAQRKSRHSPKKFLAVNCFPLFLHTFVRRFTNNKINVPVYMLDKNTVNRLL